MGRKLMKKEAVIEKLQSIYGDKYDFSDIVYTGMRNKVTILCKQHGTFTDTPANLLKGRGCPLCRKESGLTKFRKRRNKVLKSTGLSHINKIDDAIDKYLNDDNLNELNKVEQLVRIKLLIKEYQKD